ncbi:Uncharacterised protein r2_g1427 [Pycnogonum litorale]
MAAVDGNVGEFNPGLERFEDYSDRIDAFMAVNSIEDGKKTNLYLATVGAETFPLLKNLCSPAKPNSFSYEGLKAILKKHFNPNPIIIAERFRYWVAKQGEDESVSAFLVRLKKLASTCGFGSFLNDALRDRLVSGLHHKNSRTRRTLLCTSRKPALRAGIFS